MGSLERRGGRGGPIRESGSIVARAAELCLECGVVGVGYGEGGGFLSLGLTLGCELLAFRREPLLDVRNLFAEAAFDLTRLLNTGLQDSGLALEIFDFEVFLLGLLELLARLAQLAAESTGFRLELSVQAADLV